MSYCTCCCRRCILLYHIEDATLDDIKSYLRGLFRLYCFLVILNVLNVASTYDNVRLFIFNVTGLSLYIGNTVALRFVSTDPTNVSTIWSMIFASLLCIFNIISTIYLGVEDNNPWAVLYVVSIAIQVSTVYIVHKLREKLLDSDNYVFDTADIKTPLAFNNIDM